MPNCKVCGNELKKMKDKEGNIFLYCKDCKKKYALPKPKIVPKVEEEEEFDIPAPAPVVEEPAPAPVVEEPAPAPVVEEPVIAPTPISIPTPAPAAAEAPDLAEIAESLAGINTSLKALVALLNKRLVIVDIDK